jgi:hypothetical protein
MDIRESGQLVFYRHQGTWHSGVLRQWRRESQGWVGDVWHGGGPNTVPIPPEHLVPKHLACHQCVLTRRRPGYS